MKRVAMLLFPGVQALDVAGPLDVFAEANAFVAPGSGYQVLTLAERGFPIPASNGQLLGAQHELDGAVGGFDQPFQNLVLTCGYFPHPYAYHLTERGNSSYQHDVYVVDYIVHQPTGGSAWQRGSVPLTCRARL